MDEDARQALETGLSVVLRPVTDLTETVLGLLGGDFLSEIRKRNRATMADKTKRILEERGVKPDGDIPPVDMIPLVAAAQDESRDELLDVYAKLLAAAADPKRRGAFRREFVEIARQLEPLDVAVLLQVQAAGATSFDPTRAVNFAQRLEVPTDNVVNAFEALHRLGLTQDGPGLNAKTFPMLSAKGRQFLMAISN